MSWNEIRLDLRLMLNRVVFSLGMILVLVFNVLIIPVHVFYRVVLKRNIWPVVWPPSLKQRLDLYKKHYQESVEKFIYKQPGGKK